MVFQNSFFEHQRKTKASLDSVSLSLSLSLSGSLQLTLSLPEVGGSKRAVGCCPFGLAMRFCATPWWPPPVTLTLMNIKRTCSAKLQSQSFLWRPCLGFVVLKRICFAKLQSQSFLWRFCLGFVILKRTCSAKALVSKFPLETLFGFCWPCLKYCV
jgi:hypothetical protein